VEYGRHAYSPLPVFGRLIETKHAIPRRRGIVRFEVGGGDGEVEEERLGG
jgi:hypothetical protein